MGHLFSRALRRLTQCSQSAGGAPQPTGQQEEQEQQQHLSAHQAQPDSDDNGPPSATVQSIPVGQSIDSAEYSALAEGGAAAAAAAAAEQDKPQVEEAVIKIQALVRGHLARKALKDAQQPAAAAASAARPPLGQSQFDEDSLTKNRLAATGGGGGGGAGGPPTSSSPASRSPLLESIAEDAEVAAAAAAGSPANPTRPRLSSLERSLDSPVPSEANASIELRCDTPASASIDILDHHLTGRPADGGGPAAQRIAAVLHPEGGGGGARAGPQPASNHAAGAEAEAERPPNSPETPSDSAEQAAIRIQSAFRGYKTRKHSPYRRRRAAPGEPAAGLVPNGTPATGAHLLNAPEEDADDEEQDDEGIGGEEPAAAAAAASSRLPDSSDEASAALARQDSTGTVRELEPTGGALLASDSPRTSIPGDDAGRAATASGKRRPSAELDLSDSSNLGAALSMNEDSLLDEQPLAATASFSERAAPTQANDDDEEQLTRSAGANLVEEVSACGDTSAAAAAPAWDGGESRRLARARAPGGDSLDALGDDEDSAGEFGEPAGALVESILGEEEPAEAELEPAGRLSGELESDDVERRDPSGAGPTAAAESPVEKRDGQDDNREEEGSQSDEASSAAGSSDSDGKRPQSRQQPAAGAKKAKRRQRNKRRAKK